MKTISRRKFFFTTGPLVLAAGLWDRLPSLSYAIDSADAVDSASRNLDETQPRATHFSEFTNESNSAIRKGLEWLIKTIRPDGGCGVDIGENSDIGCTAMVGMAFITQGNTLVNGPRSRQLRELTYYLLKCVERMPEDDITSERNSQLQQKIGRHAHTFFATLFLSQVLGQGVEPNRAREALTKLVETVCKTQSDDGAWGQSSWAPVLGTVMGWSCLRGAHFAGFNVKASAENTAKHLVEDMEKNLNQHAGRGNWMHTLYKNATGVRVLSAMGMDSEPIAKKAFGDALSLITKDNTPFSQAGGEEFLAFHLITETMLQRGGEDWAKWFPTCRDKMIQVQNKDGSWTGRHCITSRTFCTAAAILVLSAPNRYLPISQS